MRDILQIGLSLSLVLGVGGSIYIARVNKDFAGQYGRIVESLISGSLGAVAGGTYVAMQNRKKADSELEATEPVRTEL